MADLPAPARLRYVTDQRPGIQRRRRGAGFTYIDSTGAAVRDAATLARIRRLAIPPAWTSVWICELENGHIQAVGRDARGRKQYRYHAEWSTFREQVKFDRLANFARALPRLRRRVRRDLATRGVSREKILAAVVRLLECTFVRIGNDEYARHNRSFGLTTLRNRHVEVKRDEVRLRFRGKSGQLHEIAVTDRRLAAIVRRCQDLPGQELFAYIDADGMLHDVTSDDVNAYIREAARGDFTAKDFRTWSGTILCAEYLARQPRWKSPKEAQQHLVDAVKAGAGALGNTPPVCRKAYVHPVIFESYLLGTFPGGEPATSARGLTPEEQRVLSLLEQPSGEQRLVLRPALKKGKRTPYRQPRPHSRTNPS